MSAECTYKSNCLFNRKFGIWARHVCVNAVIFLKCQVSAMELLFDSNGSGGAQICGIG